VRALVFVERYGGEPTPASVGVLSRAAALAEETAAVVCGPGAAEAAAVLGAFGAGRAFAADHPALASELSQPVVDVLTGLVREEGFDTVLFAASALACDVAGGLADRLEAGLNWDLIDLEVRDGRLVGKRLALQDTVLLDVGWKGEPRLGVLRPGAVKPVAGGGRAAVEPVPVDVEEWSLRAALVGRTQEISEGPSIEDAEIIVAGGRGLGSKDGFALLEELASALRGTVAASLPAVEIGWYPYDRLVGLSGKTVQPKLYFACGISGAVQHKMGMDGSGTIVAVNRDPSAAIFDFCDVAVVGDLYEIVPRLTELLRQWAAAGA